MYSRRCFIIGLAVIVDHSNFCWSDTLLVNRFDGRSSSRKIDFVLEMRVVVCYSVLTTG